DPGADARAQEQATSHEEPAASDASAQTMHLPLTSTVATEEPETDFALPARHELIATAAAPTIIRVDSAEPPPVPPSVIAVLEDTLVHSAPDSTAAGLDAVDISAWFGTNKVLERVSLSMPPRTVTALIGPSGCGKSTFLRILNRMHESVPSAKLAGEVRLNGQDIYAADQRVTETRKRIGMVFQKPNPFPTMSISENVVAGLKLTGTKI